MNQAKSPDFSNKKKCISCGKQANLLCDIVTGAWRWAGHPPKVNGVALDIPLETKTTCDKPICDKCAIHLNEHMDICGLY